MKIMVYHESDEAFCTGGNVQLESSKRISIADFVVGADTCPAGIYTEVRFHICINPL